VNKKILIIGKKSFIGSNLEVYLSKFYIVQSISYDNFKKKKQSFFSNFSHIINTSIHKNYINKKYDEKYDFDKKIVNKLYKYKFFYYYLNTRKIYKPKLNITESSTLKPKNNYEKNKLITEKYLIKKLNKMLVSLRTTNVIGKRIFIKNRNNHKLFLDNFINFKRDKKKLVVENDFKDFITIDHFCLIIKCLIKKDISGIFNVSLSEKVYISEITKWLSPSYYDRLTFKNKNSDSFTLSNKKLLKKISISINKKDLMKFCKKMKI
tara:strand:- start:1818 stop:2612 length:795 start_codon:yes stop_codon:yes gene_type:complete